jgi:hypothetical protein
VDADVAGYWGDAPLGGNPIAAAGGRFKGRQVRLRRLVRVGEVMVIILGI